MSKTALLFSGQGSQYAGMAKDFYDNYESAKAVFAAADKALGYSLEDIVFAEDPTELNKTVHSQPAIMACSLCAFEALKEVPKKLLIANPQILLAFIKEGAAMETRARKDEQEAHRPTQHESAEDEALQKLDDILGRIKSGF